MLKNIKQIGMNKKTKLKVLNNIYSVAPRVGFEPTTDRLTADCSTTELPRISH